MSAVSFDVSSTPVVDLHPGAAKRTRLTFANPYPFSISVRSVGAAVASTSKRSCKPAAANLRIGQYLGSLPLNVPARGRRSAGELEVTMPNSVADACQRTTFQLKITASAVRVGR
ncbi:hypothetical protein [Actinoplanes sp. NBRC 101535]|uniref:hypothetical protein n=1 Tax=Actinoplanes sp. NBRC 101535 TaxID=3032196 RepID=UPI00255455BF|nr:hypothetical protein [Actinoplanes sp. NBRC 101535]